MVLSPIPIMAAPPALAPVVIPPVAAPAAAAPAVAAPAAPARRVLSFAEEQRTISELERIRRQIANSGLNDPMTRSLVNWQEGFAKHFRAHRADTAAVLQTYIDLLKQIMVDPIIHVPLDDLAVLGSDNHAYNYQYLNIRLNSGEIPEGQRNRSPYDPMDPRPFTAQPHTNVRHLVGWLRGQRVYEPDSKIEAEFKRLQDRNIVLIRANPPTAEEFKRERIDGLLAIQRGRDQKKVKAEEDQEKKINENKERLENLIVNRFGPIEQRCNDAFQGFNNRLAAVQQGNDNHLVQLNQMADNLLQQCDKMETEIKVLKEQEKSIQAGIETTHLANIQLQQDVHQTLIEIKKRNSKWIKDLCIAAAVVGGCMIASWAVGAVLSSGGGGAAAVNGAVLPTKGGGAMLKIGISI